MYCRVSSANGSQGIGQLEPRLPGELVVGAGEQPAQGHQHDLVQEQGEVQAEVGTDRHGRLPAEGDVVQVAVDVLAHVVGHERVQVGQLQALGVDHALPGGKVEPVPGEPLQAVDGEHFLLALRGPPVAQGAGEEMELPPGCGLHAAGHGFDGPGGARKAQAAFPDAPLAPHPAQLQVDPRVPQVQGKLRQAAEGEARMRGDAVETITLPSSAQM